MDKENEIVELGINKAIIFESEPISDFRGSVNKIFSNQILERNGISFNTKEELIIYSKENVLRGLHFQKYVGQAKLIRVLSGKIYAVIVDLQNESNTFGKWVSLYLECDGTSLYVPDTCALGTFALEDTTLSCKCGSEFVAHYSDGIIWNDEELGIDWPVERLGIDPILSEKDMKWKTFREYISNNEKKMHLM